MKGIEEKKEKGVAGKRKARTEKDEMYFSSNRFWNAFSN
jgi:hypothetical protein